MKAKPSGQPETDNKISHKNVHDRILYVRLTKVPKTNFAEFMFSFGVAMGNAIMTPRQRL